MTAARSAPAVGAAAAAGLRGPSSGAGGFALVEALASLVIVGMIALMLAGGATTGQRVWERLDSRAAAGEAVESAQAALRDRLEQTYPATLYDQAVPHPDFRGDGATLTFLADPPQAGRPAPLRRYTLAMDAAGQLVLSSISDIGPPDRAVASREVLLGEVRRLDIAYFGTQASDGVRRWRSVWRGEPDLPEVVRIRVAFDAGDARQWPDLIVRPRASVDAGCLLNPVSHHCKGRL